MMQFELRRRGFRAVLCAFCVVEILVGPQWILAQSTAAQPVVVGQQTLDQLGGKDKQSAAAEAGLGQKTAPSTTKDQKSDRDQKDRETGIKAGKQAQSSEAELGLERC